MSQTAQALIHFHIYILKDDNGDKLIVITESTLYVVEIPAWLLCPQQMVNWVDNKADDFNIKYDT